MSVQFSKEFSDKLKEYYLKKYHTTLEFNYKNISGAECTGNIKCPHICVNITNKSNNFEQFFNTFAHEICHTLDIITKDQSYLSEMVAEVFAIKVLGIEDWKSLVQPMLNWGTSYFKYKKGSWKNALQIADSLIQNNKKLISLLEEGYLELLENG